MSANEVQDVLERADEYWRHALYKTNGYYLAARSATKLHACLGGSAIAIGAIVSTSIFATITKEPGVAFAVATGLLVVVAAVLSALQTFFGARLNEDIDRNRAAAAGYAPLIRELELFRLEHGRSTDRAAALGHLRRLSDQMTEVERESPPLADRFYNRARNQRQQRRGRQPAPIPAHSSGEEPVASENGIATSSELASDSGAEEGLT